MKKHSTQTTGLLLSTLALANTNGLEAQNDKRPNILFIMSDDHTSQAWGVYGGILQQYVVNTNIKRLRNEGCLLQNCLVSNSLSVPSRASILTGQYSHTNGVKTLAGGLNSNIDNIAKQLQSGGYQTALIGKWHLKNEPTGFDFYSVLPGQGEYWNPLLIKKGDWIAGEKGGKVHPGYCTDIVGDMMINWMENRNKTKPFVAMCHFKSTHEPFDFPERHKDLHKDIVFPNPSTFYDRAACSTGRVFEGQSIDNLQKRYLRATADTALRHEYMNYPGLPFIVNGLNPDEARMKTYQKFLHDYIRCGAAIDDNIGKLLDYLDKNGLTENTVVIYTSDQGYFLGEHGWFDKRMIYEESIRMPFVIRFPKEIPAASTNHDIVENVDIPALFADYAGVKQVTNAQGRSFRNNLNGKTPNNWRAYGYYRYWEHLDDRPGHFGIRGKRYKLAFYYGNGFARKTDKPGDLSKREYWEFFDLQKDPTEIHNAYKDVAYQKVIGQMKDELKRQRMTLGDTDTDNPEILRIIQAHWDK